MINNKYAMKHLNSNISKMDACSDIYKVPISKNFEQQAPRQK